ncbi:MAG TPA: hypothetical protein VEL07_00200 [Planctomycetota bacterium]|nr:hypothetical protein [Planctomycetota bacterium]
MQFDISRDFLDGIALQQPQKRDATAEVQAKGQLRFLPSSPDGTLHTAVVEFALTVDPNAPPFARAGWRFLFTSSETFDPKADPQNPFFASMMMVGIGKVLVAINTLCMHANLPLVPFEPSRLVQQAQPNAAAAASAPKPA